MTEPERKIDILRRHMAAGDWRAALGLASKFSRLGEHKADITRAWEAMQRPEFYRAIGKSPNELIALGVAALRARYKAAP